MPTDAQTRQRKHFNDKGLLARIRNISYSLSNDSQYSRGFRDKCSVVNWYANKLLTEFNKEVGWDK